MIHKLTASEVAGIVCSYLEKQGILPKELDIAEVEVKADSEGGWYLEVHSYADRVQ